MSCLLLILVGVIVYSNCLVLHIVLLQHSHFITASIEENELVGSTFDEYGVKLKEEGDFTALGM